MAKLYFRGTADMRKSAVTMRGNRYIDTIFYYGDPNDPERIKVRLNRPDNGNIPMMWINTDKAKLPFKLIVDGEVLYKK
jgi:hypothetical protein